MSKPCCRHMLPRLVISGLSGGSGKTLFALGLTRALARQGLAVAPCKKGPDYIDAAWMGLAASWKTRQLPINLDPFFLSEDRLRAQLLHRGQHSHVAIIEGNRGLFDGRDVQGTCSTATLSRALAAPTVVVIDCTKMTRTVAAVVAGLARFEPFAFAGVVLNRVGTERHETILRQSIEEYTDISVLGVLPRMTDNPMPERHMGLAGGEALNAEADARLDRLARLIERHSDVPRLLAIARSAPELCCEAPFWPAPANGCAVPPADGIPRPRIGIVHDKALWFYYAENLEALQRAGAELVRVSLLAAEPWPQLDGLYLGGGFPEAVAEALSLSPRVAALGKLAAQGLPIYAECGGLMVLCSLLRVHHTDYPMAGVFPLRAQVHTKPQGLGYIEAQSLRETPFHPLGARFRGHEFHYSSCELLHDACTGQNDKQLDCTPLFTADQTPTLRLASGTGMGVEYGTAHRADGMLVQNTEAAYTHLFAPATPHWAPRFVQTARHFSLQGK